MVEMFGEDNFNVLRFYASFCETPDDIEAMCAVFRAREKPSRIAELLASAELFDDQLKDSLLYATGELLRQAIETSDQGKSPYGLPVLVALASREDAFFEPARDALNAWIDKVAGDTDLGQAIGEHADKMLRRLWDIQPQLRPEYRLALVKGLANHVRGPNWETALVRLISFLDNPDLAARQAAAVCLSKILVEEPVILAQCQSNPAFAAEKDDRVRQVWPADSYFPAGVVHKLVGAVQDPTALVNPVLIEAARVYRQVTGGPAKNTMLVDQSDWRHAVRDGRFVRWRHAMGRSISVIACSLLLIGELVLLFYTGLGMSRDEAYHFTRHDGWRTISSATIAEVKASSEQAETLIKAVRVKHPDHTRVVKRGQDFVTVGEDTLPKSARPVFDKLQRLTGFEKREPLSEDEVEMLVELGCDPKKVRAFADLEALALPSAWTQDSTRGMRVPPKILSGNGWWRWPLLVLVAFVLLGVNIFLISAPFMPRETWDDGGGLAFCLSILGHLAPFLCCMGGWFTLALPFLLLLGSYLVGWAVFSFPWPNNPYAGIFDAFVRDLVKHRKPPRSKAAR